MDEPENGALKGGRVGDTEFYYTPGATQRLLEHAAAGVHILGKASACYVLSGRNNLGLPTAYGLPGRLVDNGEAVSPDYDRPAGENLLNYSQRHRLHSELVTGITPFHLGDLLQDDYFELPVARDLFVVWKTKVGRVIDQQAVALLDRALKRSQYQEKLHVVSESVHPETRERGRTP